MVFGARLLPGGRRRRPPLLAVSPRQWQRRRDRRHALVPARVFLIGDDMSEADRLRPATMEEIADSIAFALRYEGRKRITADRLVRHLRGSGFVVMREPGARAPTDQPGEGDQGGP